MHMLQLAIQLVETAMATMVGYMNVPERIALSKMDVAMYATSRAINKGETWLI